MQKADRPMTATERLFHAIIFEIGAVGLTMAVFAGFGNHNATHTGTLAIAISAIAVLWNMAFNWAFDKLITGDRLSRGLKIRLVHMTLFEGGLFLATVPLIAWWLHVSLWQAFVMDIGIVMVIAIYTLIFNWAYDWLRHCYFKKFLRKNP